MVFKVLLVEDTESDIDTFSTTCERMNEAQEEKRYEVQVAKTIEEANVKIRDNEYQGCVVDINLKGNDNGNDFIKDVMEQYRIPVVVYTGTPDVESAVKIFIKGEKNPEDVINELTEEDATGMFKVLGGTGELEKKMNKLFWNVLYPQIDIWKKHHSEGKNTEEVLLRYTIAHLIELLDENGPSYCTEEMYIKRVEDTILHTGSLVKKIEGDGTLYIVLSPPCDLALHQGNMKTDRVLVCQIEHKIEDIIYQRTKKIEGEQEKKDVEKRTYTDIRNNRFSEYYHWLPDNALFCGGLINFRKIETFKPSDFKKKHELLNVKISYLFVKNILNRFSAYYSRQGQPDFCFDVDE